MHTDGCCVIMIRVCGHLSQYEGNNCWIVLKHQSTQVDVGLISFFGSQCRLDIDPTSSRKSLVPWAYGDIRSHSADWGPVEILVWLNIRISYFSNRVRYAILHIIRLDMRFNYITLIVCETLICNWLTSRIANLTCLNLRFEYLIQLFLRGPICSSGIPI